MTDTFNWLNPPPAWSGDTSGLTFTTGERTDFWRETHYGFVRDSGHAWLAPAEGDLTLSARFQAGYTTLYDQAGLMLRRDDAAWIKTGIEFTDGLMHFSVVVTGPRSDWSVIPLPGTTTDAWITARLTRRSDAVLIDFRVDDGPWQIARLAPFPAGRALAGITACSPERAGLEVRFEDIRLGPPVDRPLHTD